MMGVIISQGLEGVVVVDFFSQAPRRANFCFGKGVYRRGTSLVKKGLTRLLRTVERLVAGGAANLKKK